MSKPAPSWIARLRDQARRMLLDLGALALALRDPRTPWYARAWSALVLIYALSPLDLIPDVIPVLGLLDDLLLVPLGIIVARRLVPPALLAEYRAQAATAPPLARRRVYALLTIGIWLLAAAALWANWP